MTDIGETTIGIAHLPNQIHRTNVIKGFDFNLLIAGDSGLGKSTFLNMLFRSDLYTESSYDRFNYKCSTTPEFKSSHITLNENAVKLRMELIELGDIGWTNDNEESWSQITKYITDRLDSYLRYEDSASNSDKFRDSRIHCCLYFIPPLTHCLRLVDVKFLQIISQWVNVIPLISKSDTMTKDEIHTFKFRVRDELIKNNIKVYTFPDLSDPNNYYPKSLQLDFDNNSSYKDLIPFAITGSLLQIEEDGKLIFVRKYPWGTVKVDDPEHSDYEIFKNLFLKTHMFHLIFYTEKCIYERYRRSKLCRDLGIENNFNDNVSDDEVSNLATEVMDLEISKKKEEEYIDKLEAKFDQQYRKKENEFKDIITSMSNDHKQQIELLEKEFATECLLHRTPSKNSRKKNDQDLKSEKNKKYHTKNKVKTK